MNPVEPTKKAFTSPETDTVQLATTISLLQVSNPGGTVPPLDPDEG